MKVMAQTVLTLICIPHCNALPWPTLINNLLGDVVNIKSQHLGTCLFNILCDEI